MPTLFTPQFVRWLNSKGWVTIGAHDHEGGTHVFIDDATGEITHGPSGMVGKKPGELSGHHVTAVHGANHPETGTPEGPKKQKPVKKSPLQASLGGWKQTPEGVRKSARLAFKKITGQERPALEDSGKITEVDHIPGALFALGEANLGTGEIKMARHAAAELDRFNAGARDEPAIQGAHVLLHEEGHLQGPVAESARTMQVESIEEITNEIVARMVTAEQLGVAGKIIPNSARHRFGGYQRSIKATVDELAKQQGVSFDEAAKSLQSAAVKFRSRPERLTDYRTALYAFVSDLGYDPKDSEQMRSALTVIQAGHKAYHGG